MADLPARTIETVTRYACDALGVPAAQFDFDPERLERATDEFVALVHTRADKQHTRTGSN